MRRNLATVQRSFFFWGYSSTVYSLLCFLRLSSFCFLFQKNTNGRGTMVLETSQRKRKWSLIIVAAAAFIFYPFSRHFHKNLHETGTKNREQKGMETNSSSITCISTEQPVRSWYMHTCECVRSAFKFPCCSTQSRIINRCTFQYSSCFAVRSSNSPFWGIFSRTTSSSPLSSSSSFISTSFFTLNLWTSARLFIS